MRLGYASFVLLVWALLLSQCQDISPDMQCLSLAIVVAGALAGGDGK